MRAAIVTEYGSPIIVTEVDRPTLAPGSVLIEVHASWVNPIDSSNVNFVGVSLARAGFNGVTTDG